MNEPVRSRGEASAWQRAGTDVTNVSGDCLAMTEQVTAPSYCVPFHPAALAREIERESCVQCAHHQSNYALVLAGALRELVRAGDARPERMLRLADQLERAVARREVAA